MRWILASTFSILVVSVTVLQTELNDVRHRLAAATTQNQSTAAALEKLEKDLFAKMRADEKTRLAILALEQAQRNRAINEGLNRLPLGDFDKPMLWR